MIWLVHELIHWRITTPNLDSTLLMRLNSIKKFEN